MFSKSDVCKFTLMICFAIEMIAWLASNSNAFALPQAKPIQQIIASSDVIIIAKVLAYIPDEKVVTTLKPSQQGLIMLVGPKEFLESKTVQSSGEYRLQVVQTVKGHTEPTFSIKLPAIVSYFYGSAKVHVDVGGNLLLFLHNGANGRAEATDQWRPFVPVTDAAANSVSHKDTNEENSVFNLLVASMDDAVLRQANTYILRDSINPQVIVGLAPYLDDPNKETRSNVLYCMAENQQVSVIPRIAALQKETKIKHNGTATNTVLALGGFTTPEAVPYLNPLLFEATYYTRLNTMFSLDKIADRTSVPYLMLALRDPDPQKVIPSSAWGLLHRVVPALKRSMEDSDTFYKNRAAETKLLYDWWNDELSGKHVPKTPEGQKVLSITLPADAPLPVLNTSLFEPSSALREAAMARLRKEADASSIPYLVLALQDPDNTVAYGAYSTLYRLIPSLGQAQGVTSFEDNPTDFTKPIYIWWNDELQRKH